MKIRKEQLKKTQKSTDPKNLKCVFDNYFDVNIKNLCYVFGKVLISYHFFIRLDVSQSIEHGFPPSDKYLEAERDLPPNRKEAKKIDPTPFSPDEIEEIIFKGSYKKSLEIPLDEFLTEGNLKSLLDALISIWGLFEAFEDGDIELNEQTIVQAEEAKAFILGKAYELLGFMTAKTVERIRNKQGGANKRKEIKRKSLEWLKKELSKIEIDNSRSSKDLKRLRIKAQEELALTERSILRYLQELQN